MEVIDAINQDVQEHDPDLLRPVSEQFVASLLHEDITANFPVIHVEQSEVVVDHPETGLQNLCVLTTDQDDPDCVEKGNVVEIGRESLVEVVSLLEQLI
jgi:hypothetical protein